MKSSKNENRFGHGIDDHKRPNTTIEPQAINGDEDAGITETPDKLPFLTEQEKAALLNAGLPIDHPMIQDMLRKCPD